MLQNFTQVNNFPPQVSSCNHSSSIVVYGCEFQCCKTLLKWTTFHHRWVVVIIIMSHDVTSCFLLWQSQVGHCVAPRWERTSNHCSYVCASVIAHLYVSVLYPHGWTYTESGNLSLDRLIRTPTSELLGHCSQGSQPCPHPLPAGLPVSHPDIHTESP